MLRSQTSNGLLDSDKSLLTVISVAWNSGSPMNWSFLDYPRLCTSPQFSLGVYGRFKAHLSEITSRTSPMLSFAIASSDLNAISPKVARLAHRSYYWLLLWIRRSRPSILHEDRTRKTSPFPWILQRFNHNITIDLPRSSLLRHRAIFPSPSTC